MSSSSSQSSQSTNLHHATSLASSGGDRDEAIPKNAGTYPFTQSSITSSQTNNDDAEVDDPPPASSQKTTTNTSSSSSTNIRKSSRQVTPSSKRSHQLNTYNGQMLKSKQKRQKVSVQKKKESKTKSFQTTMTQCVPFHVDISHQSTPTQPTSKDTKVVIMKHASSHKKHNRIFVGASVYSRSIGTELEPLQPGKKKG
jgi:acetyl/propionyl-CoA carboxylase alpha subunit